MRVAFAAWNDRIAPLFDVTRRLHVVDTAGRKVVRESEEYFEETALVARAARLAALGVDTLVCGAISRAQEALIEAYGLAVVPFVKGDLEDVVDAWRTDQLGRPAFSMPGCGGGRRHRLRAGRAWGPGARGWGRGAMRRRCER
jgi:predicted Fe-Mo cluster-binding NifX family protein